MTTFAKEEDADIHHIHDYCDTLKQQSRNIDDFPDAEYQIGNF
jgi:hypothetical protein